MAGAIPSSSEPGPRDAARRVDAAQDRVELPIGVAPHSAALIEAPPRVQPVQTSPFSFGCKLRMAIWGLVRATLFQWSPAPLRGFRRVLLRAFGAKLSATASVHNLARIDCPWNLEMGERASVGEHAWVYALDKIIIGDETCVGQRVLLLTGSHDFADPTFPLRTRPIRIGYGCWLAVGAIVLPGVTIGSLAVVGSGSVVTRDLPEQMVCAGNPCRPLKRRDLKQPAALAA